MAGAFSHFKLTDKLACQATLPSPQISYGALHYDDLVTASDVQAVEDQESLSFSFTRLDKTGGVRPITAQMRAGRVITTVMEDGSTDAEWRVGVVTMGRGKKGIVSVECVPILFDIVERADSSSGRGWVSDLSAGERNFEYEIVQRTPASILSAYVIPNCPSWVTLGTVDPSYVIQQLSVSRMTPGQMAFAVRDALRQRDVPCEVRLRRNGTTDYKLDLVTQIGASANTPVFHPSNSLLALEQKADPTLQATRVLVTGASAPDGLPGRWGMARWKVVSVVGNVITLADRNGGPSPIGFDTQFVGNYLLRVKTGRTFAITASSASGGSVTCGGGVSTLAADEDVEFRLDEPLNNTRSTLTRYAVSAVPDGTHITMGVSAPIVANDQYVDWYAKVWSASSAGVLIATTRISGSVAATDVIAVASSAGVNTTHFVEFVQLDGAGEIPSAVDHPIYAQADPIGYGIKAMELTRPMAGVTQLVPNSWMRTWTNGANPPDGWSITSFPLGGESRNSSPTFTRYGGYSWRAKSLVLGTVYGLQRFVTPTFYHATTNAARTLAVRTFVYADQFVGDASVLLEVFALKGDGTFGTLLGSSKAGSPTYSPADATLSPEGTWLELQVGGDVGITLSPSGDPASVATAPFGMRARITATIVGGTDAFDLYVDSVEAYPFSGFPSEPLEFGDAPALEQSGNNKLREVATPPLFYTFTIRDLERANPGEYARLALTLGGNVRAADVEYGIDTTVRLLRRDRDLLVSDKTTLTLANRPALLTSIQGAEAVNTQQAIADAARSGGASGQSFIAPTTATALPSGTEVTTPAVGAPVFSLSVGMDDIGSSITYAPNDPSTAPSTGVVAGTPLSRSRLPTTQTRRIGFTGGVGPVGVDAVFDSTLIGYLALANNLSGVNNSAFGYQTLTSNTTGGYNTALGHAVLALNTIGINNIGVGYQALTANVDGYNNVAAGYQALGQNTSGFDNCAFGTTALLCNTTGSENTGIGQDALYTNTIGVNNTGIGSNALGFNIIGNSNTAVGQQSMFNSTGSNNTASGAQSMAGPFSSGSANVAMGYQALYSHTTGTANVVVGYTAGYHILAGSDNVFMGDAAGFATTSGNSNVAIGPSALHANTTASYSVAIGVTALFASTGAQNTAVGGGSLQSLVTGTGCVALGFSAGAYETGSDKFYVDNQDRTNTAGDVAKALLYGIFDAAAANQRLRINAKVGIGGAATSTSPLNITGLPTSAAGLAAGDVWKNGSVLTIV